MATKTHIAWSVAAVALVTAMGLGGALYRTLETSKKQEETIDYLRAEQAKIGALSHEDKQKLASDVARLERELTDAQNAQRALTDEVFAAKEEAAALSEKLQITIAPQVKEVTVVKESPYPAYITLRKAIMAGAPYQAEWEALQQQVPVSTEIKQVITAHISGVTSLDALKHELRETFEQTQEVTQEHPVLSRLGNVLSVRKLDKEHDTLREIVRTGNLKQAADMLRTNAAYQDWIAAYDARRDVLKALDAVEAQLAGQDG